jgi:hypothetical protein
MMPGGDPATSPGLKGTVSVLVCRGAAGCGMAGCDQVLLSQSDVLQVCVTSTSQGHSCFAALTHVCCVYMAFWQCMCHVLLAVPWCLFGFACKPHSHLPPGGM